MTTLTIAQPPPRPVDVQPHLSASQLRTYALCSLQWRFSRQYEPEFLSSGLLFGGAFHKALEAFYQGRLEGREVLQDELLAVFDRQWDDETLRPETPETGKSQNLKVSNERQPLPVVFGKAETRETLRETASRMIGAFLAQVPPSRIVAIEERFECPLATGLPPLVGFIDLVEIRQDADGHETLVLVDHKTAGRKPSGIEDLDPDQLVLYGIGAHRIGLLKQFAMPFALEYRVATKTKKPEVVTVAVKPTPHQARQLIEKAKICWQGMQSGICFPNPGWQCAGCGYQTRCRQWPDLKK